MPRIIKIFSLIIAIVILIIICNKIYRQNKYMKRSFQEIKSELQKIQQLENPLLKLSREELLETTYTDKKTVLTLYQMMKDVHEIFEKRDIIYWTSGGVSLGILRHKGLIPWDHDIDINILHSDELKLQDLKAELESLGYYLSQDTFMYRISLKDNVFDQAIRTSHPFLEVYIMRKDTIANKFIYTHEMMREFYPKEYYYEDKLFPLKKYLFGNIYIWGPGDLEWYVNHYYGNDWNEIARLYPSRSNVQNLGNILLDFNLTEKSRQPAQPMGPLENRIK